MAKLNPKTKKAVAACVRAAKKSPKRNPKPPGTAFGEHVEKATISVASAAEQMKMMDGLLDYLKSEHMTGMQQTWPLLSDAEKKRVGEARKDVAKALKAVAKAREALNALAPEAARLDAQRYYI